jgi:hypothetical protein
MKYVLIAFVVIVGVGFLLVMYPRLSHQSASPVTSEKAWQEKIADCSEMKVPKHLNAVVNKFSEEGRKVIVNSSSASPVIYECPDGMFVY